MGKVSEPDTERNIALINDYKAKIFTTAELTAKYKISTARIYQILKANKVKRHKKG